ncbi:M23 family metallopeptidase [Micromonospora sp. NPDC052213]|uniref:murein hydrolase activator EnvC family protein n=1 Tax=Micromonospora sp. NPDC052213 TaxID=3155812 RepID=UPI00343AA85B
MRPATRTGVAALCAALLSLGPAAVPGTGPVPAPVGAAAAVAPDLPPLPEAPTPGAARFRWPLDGAPRPVRRFDPPPQPWLPGHRGVDLAAAPGATVRAAGAGTVLFAGMVAGRPVVSVGHADGLRTTYEPVSPAVRPGDRLAAGEPLGALLAGHPGCPAPACLHWGLRRGAEYLDPLALLGLGPVRLLPLDGAGTGPSPGGGRVGRAGKRRRRACRACGRVGRAGGPGQAGVGQAWVCRAAGRGNGGRR